MKRIKRSFAKLTLGYYKLSLTWMMGLTFVAVVTLCGGIVLYMSVLTNLKNTRSLIEKASIMSTESINNALGSFIYPIFSTVYAIKSYAEEQSSPNEALTEAKQIFRGALLGTDNLYGLVLSQRDGEVWGLRRDETRKGLIPFKPTQELFRFSELQKSQSTRSLDPFWGDFYPGNDNPFVAISGSIRINGETVGYVTAILTVKAMGSVLSPPPRNRLVTQEKEEDVTRFILSQNNEVLAYSSPTNNLQEHNLLEKVSEFGDPVLANLENSEVEKFGKRAQQKGVELHLIDDGSEVYVLVLQRQHAPDGEAYYVGEYQLANSRYDEFTRLINSVIAGIAVVFLSALVAIFFSRRLSKPLKEIAQRAEKFGALEFEHLEPLPRSHIRELDQITSAMNASTSGLQAMSRYIPKSLYAKLMKLGINRAAKAREAELTILFTDIAGFTSLSEHKSAGETTELLNNHFKLLVKAVETHQGTVDKFIGDGMLAFWGAPDEVKDHAQRAIAAAEDIVKLVDLANMKKPENALTVRVAIHTGSVVVGNVGAVERWNYTVVGDAVNVCSRLQNLEEAHITRKGACVLLSGETVAKAGYPDNLTYRGSHEIRGRKGKVDVWQLNSTICDEEC